MKNSDRKIQKSEEEHKCAIFTIKTCRVQFILKRDGVKCLKLLLWMKVWRNRAAVLVYTADRKTAAAAIGETA